MNLRGIFGVALTSVLLLSGSPSAEEPCPFCNASVRLDEALATCFEQQYPAELRRLSSSGSPVAVVNLAACGDEARTRGGLPVGVPDGESALLDASFMVTAGALDCLGSAVTSRVKPLKAAQLYVIAEICP